MTPPAATAAGRLAGGLSLPVPQRTRESQRPARRSDSPRKSRQSRRVSGPAVGLHVRRQIKPEVKPLAPRANLAPVAPAVATGAPSVARGALPESAFVDSVSAFRLLSRSRALIVLFAVLLGGLVFTQEQLTGMNASLGETVQQISALERDNAVLRSSISALSSDQRVVAQAKRMGYVEPPVGSSKFISVSSASPTRAAAMMVAATNPSAGEGLSLITGTNQLSADGVSVGLAGASGTEPQLTSGVAATVGTDSAASGSTAVTTAAVPSGGTDQGNG